MSHPLVCMLRQILYQRSCVMRIIPFFHYIFLRTQFIDTSVTMFYIGDLLYMCFHNLCVRITLFDSLLISFTRTGSKVCSLKISICVCVYVSVSYKCTGLPFHFHVSFSYILHFLGYPYRLWSESHAILRADWAVEGGERVGTYRLRCTRTVNYVRPGPRGVPLGCAATNVLLLLLPNFTVSAPHFFHSFYATYPPSYYRLALIPYTLFIYVPIYTSLLLQRTTWCGNKETGLLLLLISCHVDDEEEGRALTRGTPSTFTQIFIHLHQLVWP